jgi:lipopolysaccharide biosynthesis glycosyltransferase
MRKVSICFLADDNYSQHLCVTLFSLLESSRNSYLDIHVLDGGVREQNRNRIVQSLKIFSNFRLTYHQFEKNIFKGFPLWRDTDMVYARMLAPQILSDFDKVIFLDSDLIVQHAISDLWDLDLQEKSLLACSNPIPSHQGKFSEIYATEKKGLLFNTGVLVMNLKKMRELDAVQNLLALTKRNGHKLISADEDVFNLLFHEDFGRVDPRWNVMAFFFNAKSHRYTTCSKKEFEACKTSPFIIHFDGFKPWEIGSLHPHRGLYYSYLRKTKYADFRPKFRSGQLLKNFCFYAGVKTTNALPDSVYDLLFPVFKKVELSLEKIFS